MRIALDTNVLCRLAQSGHSQHAAARASVENLRDVGHELCLVPQVLYEYWVVATRPVPENGLGMAVDTAIQALESWCEIFTVLRDERGVFDIWRGLLTRHTVSGKAAHDARIVAAMLRHRIDHLLTFNLADFARFSQIVACSPHSLIESWIIPI